MMLNLNKLEKELDEVLKNETMDSLMKWLLSKKRTHKGEFIAFISEQTDFMPELSNNSKAKFITANDNDKVNNDFYLAA